MMRQGMRGWHGMRAWLLTAATAIAAISCGHGTASAQVAEYQVGKIKIIAPWTRATPESAKVGGGFMTLTNTGSEPDRLIAGSTEVAGALEIHEIHIVNGVAMMRQLNPGLSIRPGASVVLKPFSHHLMLLDLKEPLKAGQKFKGLLVFEKAGSVEIEYLVVPIGADAPAASRRPPVK
jgi:periplasmic copper chaperone A